MSRQDAFGSLRRGARSLLLLATILAGLLSTPAAEAQESYFYSGGKKQPLQVSQSWVAFRTDGSVNTAELKGDAALDPKRRADRIQSNVLIAPVRPGATRAERQNLEHALKGKRGVKRSLRAYETKLGSPMVETGDVLVQFRPEITKEQADAILAENGAEIVRPLGPYAPNGYVVRVTDDARSATDVANAIFERGVTIFSHPDFVAPAQRNYVPNDPRFEEQWYLNNTGSIAPVRTFGADIKAKRAWDLSRGSSNVTVAVLDDGFDLTHEEFQNGKVVFSYDYFDNDADASPNTYDNHGTACAGLVAATADNGKGISGVAPGCTLMLLKVGKAEGPTDPQPGATLYGSLGLANAFTAAADRGASVISCSWEFPLFDVVKSAIQYAATQGRGGRGCVIFFSSGNDSALITNEHAKLPEVIAVGASTETDVRATYSNVGPELDLVAPGSSANPLSILSTDRVGANGYTSGDYAPFGGTSAACPIAAGVGALLISKEPGLTREQVYQRLTSTADKIDRDHAGYDANGFSQSYGYGRVNALRALAASDTTPPTLSISSPEDESSSREIAPISGYAYDYGSLLEPSVDLVIYQDGQYWNGAAWVGRPDGSPVPVVLPKPQVDENGQWTFTNMPTGANLRSGVYYINASVYDAAGNANTPTPGTSSRSFRIDRSPPTITIASPVNGSVLTHVPEGGWFNGTATDDDVAEPPEVKAYLRRASDNLYWAGGGWVFEKSFGSLNTDINGTTWSCNLLPGIGADTARCMAAGEYELIVVAKDKAGNEAEVHATITVDYTLTLPNESFLTEQPEPLITAGAVTSQNGLAYPALPENDQRVQSPKFLRVDSAGNFITGMAMSLNVGDYITPRPSAAIHKHSATGEQLWRRERMTQSVTVQSQGLENTRYYERFTEGQDWIEISNLEFGGMYSLGAMEVDAQGNVYAALNLSTLEYRQYATSSSGSPLFAYLTTPTSIVIAVKFDPSGNLVWRQRVGPSESDQSWYPTSGAYAIKPLADGSAVVLVANSLYYYGGSYSPSYSFRQTVLARVGASSGEFVKHFGSYYGDDNSDAQNIGLDAAGNVYLVTAEGPRIGGYDYNIPPPDHVIRKISQTGTILREVRIDHCDAPETWKDMAVDPATGHVYIAGNYTISNEPVGRQVGMKFDLGLAEGQEMVWRTYAPHGSADPYNTVHLALSPQGVFLGGSAITDPNGRSHFSVTRISRDGALVWSRKYITPQQNFDRNGDSLENMVADATGNVYALGYTPTSTGYWQPVVRKISSFGDVQFAKLFPDNTYIGSNATDMLLLPSNTAPATIAVLAQNSASSGILLFSNPGVVYSPITVPETEPADQWVAAGVDATLTVHASGPAPLAYQWRKHMADGSIQDVLGAHGATLTISNALPSDAGQYSVVVSSNVVAPVTSRVATLTVEVTVPLLDALDGAGLTWTSGGDQPWHGQTSTSYDGVDSAVSGMVGDLGTSWLETNVTGEGVLSFRWKVSSEENYDKLKLYLDGELQTQISGEQEWAGYSLYIPEGSHTVRWAYEKDGSRVSGQDRGWVDYVSFTAGPAAPPTIDAQPSSVTTALGRDVFFSVTASGVGNLAYQWLKNGEEIQFETNSTLHVPTVTAASVGSYQVRVTGVGGSVLSNPATLTISSDTARPTVKVSTPSSNISVKSPEFTLSGTASDNEAVQTVYVYVERPNFDYTGYVADGTNKWSANVTLSPGVNRVFVFSVDAAGNESSAVVRTITYQTPAVLTVNSIGQGTVLELVGSNLKPAAASSQRLTGKAVKLVAKPAKGFICAGWSTDGGATITVPGPAFVTTLSGDLAVTAQFVPSPFPALAGTYSGIIEGTPASAATSGAFTFTMSSGGMVTGKLTYGNKQYPIKLALDANAALSGLLPGPSGTQLSLSVQFTGSGMTGAIQSGAGSLAQFTGAKVLAFNKKSPAPAEGRYTMLLDDANGTGVGHALVQVANTGKVNITGALTGGDLFVVKATLCEGNRVPIYTTMSGAGKALVGWITFAETPGVSDVSGSLMRLSAAQPSGAQLSVSGSAQEAAAGSWLLDGLATSNGAAKLTFSGGGLTGSLEQNITLGKVVSKRKKLSVVCTLPNPNTNALKLVIDPLTGAFLGSVKETATSPSLNFLGVLFQKQNLGEGRFENGNEVGTITLLPAVQ